ncbi:hypothetical protein ACCO45_000847 [Purpureocillium lilacinum]|uniref:Uncharacterized protein n=1 Tax=Purpureocillium lilacinum TaxID=33203 RepID=A0ACC4E6J9_PURLI
MPPAAAAARVDWTEGKVDDVDAVVGRESARVLWSGAGTGQHISVGKRLFRFVSYMIALKYVRNLPYRRYGTMYSDRMLQAEQQQARQLK